MATIISTAPVFPACHDMLAEYGTVEICPDMSSATLKAMIVDAVIVREEAQITEDIMSGAERGIQCESGRPDWRRMSTEERDLYR